MTPDWNRPIRLAALSAALWLLLGCGAGETALPDVESCGEKHAGSGAYLIETETYKSLLAEVEQRRGELRSAFLRAATEAEKNGIIEASRDYLFDTLVLRLFPAWYGTPWSYNGHSEEPRSGSIACGFFVSTLLKHAGFNIDRVALAQLPSEQTIKILTPESDIRRFSDRPVGEVKQAIFGWGRGLYLVGLDNHIGFIAYTGEGCPQFVHCSFVYPGKALSENIDSDNPLAWSRYRVVGKILTRPMIEKWLNGEKFTHR
jgi:hypothetical protein